MLILIKMYSLAILMILMSLIFFLMGVIFKFMELNFLFFIELFNLDLITMELSIFIDWISLLFLSVVLLISSMVIFYSIEYVENYKKRFFYLLMSFIMSMCMLILGTYSILMLFIGWDFLGLSSYCLVIFYQNYLSYKSGMITFLLNRFGDVILMLLISLLYMNNEMNFMIYSKMNFYFSVLILVAGMTKSAQMPFSAWLPAAMAAPTPVSSLVHSSTLVTAGVYLLIRYGMVEKLNELLLLISMITMLMAGISANFEYDFKKIIALSTLSQLGLMFSILSMGSSMLSYFHLLTHAMFKSMLFMCAGIIIHSMSNIQDIRFYGGFFKMMPFVSLLFNFASLSLSGFPFLSGFYSKDMILEFFFSGELNFLEMLMLIFSILLTVSYSVRLFMYMNSNMNKMMVLNNLGESSLMNYSMMILMLLTIMGGSMLNMIYFVSLNMIMMMYYFKILILMFFLFGLMMSFFLTKFKKILELKMFFYTLMYSNLIYSYMPMKYLDLSYLFMMETEKGSIESLLGYFKKNMLFIYLKDFWEDWFSLIYMLKMVFILMFLIFMEF